MKNGLNEAEVDFNEPSRDMLRALRRRKRRNTSQCCICSWHQWLQQCQRPKSREHTSPENTHSFGSLATRRLIHKQKHLFFTCFIDCAINSMMILRPTQRNAKSLTGSNLGVLTTAKCARPDESKQMLDCI